MILFITIWVFVVGTISIIMLFKTRDIKKYASIATIVIYLPFTLIPLVIANEIYKDIGSIILIAVVILGYIILRLGTEIYNKFKSRISKDKGIYIRDIDVEYSPAILSYLQNQKIEKDKDITACILDLCAKKYLNIKQEREKNYSLEIGTNKNINLLPEDEKYLYDKIVKKEKINYSEWKKIVLEEFNKYKFLKTTKISLYTIFLMLYFIIIISLAIISEINPEIQLDEGVNFMILIFFTAMELAFLEPIIITISKFLREGEYTSGIYTNAGAREMKRWDKYKNFLQDYTLIKEKEIDSVIVLEKHIAYATVLNINKDYTNAMINDLSFNYNLNLYWIKNILKNMGENDDRL